GIAGYYRGLSAFVHGSRLCAIGLAWQWPPPRRAELFAPRERAKFGERKRGESEAQFKRLQK
ncbi:unnamed protein product, partial [Effrenium voratum]